MWGTSISTHLSASRTALRAGPIQSKYPGCNSSLMLFYLWWIESLGSQLGKYLMLYFILPFNLAIEQLAGEVQLQLVRPYAGAIDGTSATIAGAWTGGGADTQAVGGQGTQALSYAVAACWCLCI